MILVVDDTHANVYALKKVLEANGFSVDTAFSGSEALKKVLKNDYVLILLDVQMPDMDGFEVAREICSIEKNKNTAIIFLSANVSDIEFIVKGYDCGGSDYIVKPVDTTILTRKVQTFYTLYETRLRNEQQQQEITRLYQREKELNGILSRASQKLIDAQRLAKMGNWEYMINTQQFIVDQEVAKFLEVEAGEAIDLSFFLQHIPLAERDFVISFWTKLATNNSFDFTHTYILDSGRLMHIKQYGKVEWLNDAPYRIVGILQDVTEEKERDAEIQKANERYELVNLATNDMMWDWDTENDLVECNNNITDIYGYKREDIGTTIEWWRNIIHPDDVQTLFDVFNETALTRRRTCHAEYRMRCADGTYKDVFNQSYCMYGAQGQLLRIISAVKDLSDLKKTERELIDTEIKLVETVENISEGFFTCNNDFEITYMNKHAERMLKITRATVIGCSLWEIFPEAKNTKFYTQYTKCITNQEPYTFEEYFAPLDSWYRVNVHPSGKGIAVYFEDITDELMQELQLNNARIQADVLNKTTRDVVWEWDLHRDTVHVNKNLNRIFGYDPQEAEVSLGWWMSRVHPEDVDRLRDSLVDAINSGDDSWEKEHRFADVNGRYHFVSDRAVILRDESASPYKVIGSMTDLQKLKENESKLKEIAFSNSHVIRKPLANILGLVELLHGETDTKVIAELVKLIKQSSNELDEVLQTVARTARR